MSTRLNNQVNGRSLQQARNHAQVVLDRQGYLSSNDLYEFAQTALPVLVAAMGKGSSQLHDETIERALDRLAKRVCAPAGTGADGGHALSVEGGAPAGGGMVSKRFLSVVSMEAYLKATIATNAVDAKRSRKVRREVSPQRGRDGQLVDVVQLVADPHAATGDATHVLEPVHQAIARGALRRALAALSPDASRVLALYMDGLSAPEIAERLGVTPAAVRQRQSRANRALCRAVFEAFDAQGVPIADLSLADLAELSPWLAARAAG